MKNEEPIMVEVNTSALEEGLNFLVVAVTTVDSVFARIVLVRRASHYERRVWNDFECVGAGLVTLSDI